MPDKLSQEELEETCANLGRVIGNALPREVGFAFVTYNFGPGGHMAYIANGQRDDLIEMLGELRIMLSKENH